MSKIKTKINSELDIMTANDAVLENVLASQEHEQRPRLRIRKRFIIAAAACMAFILMGAGIYTYVETFWRLSDETVAWYCEEAKTQYLEHTKGDVVMLTHMDWRNEKYIFEFTGAGSVTYIDDGKVITFFAQRAEGETFTLTIPYSIMYENAVPGEDSITSKGFTFEIVDEF
jgi:hypothetical protein